MKLILITITMLSMVGCAYSSPGPPTTPASVESKHSLFDSKEDKFDKTGQVVATGSRWVWNELGQAYEWVTSEEAKINALKAWDKTKAFTQSTYQDIKKNTSDTVTKTN